MIDSIETAASSRAAAMNRSESVRQKNGAWGMSTVATLMDTAVADVELLRCLVGDCPAMRTYTIRSSLPFPAKVCTRRAVIFPGQPSCLEC